MRHLLLLFVLGLLSCGNASEDGCTAIDKDSTTISDAEFYRMANQSDSANAARFIDSVAQYFAKHLQKDTTYKSEEYTFCFGNLFSTNTRHLFVAKQYSMNNSNALFVLQNEEMKPIFYNLENEFGFNYMGDTIMDINGDNSNDLVLHLYPSSGCCRRDVYRVYLYLPEANKFTAAYEFLNPTFSPKEKIIRGVVYGQPGNTELYKYKWNGLAVDTIEYIVHEKPNAKTYYKRHGVYDTTQQVKLKNIPAEYRNIESLDWFIGDGY